MTSLRIKLTAALLGVSLAGIALVGVTSRFLALRRFDVLVTDRAFQGFESEILDYYRTYGSWEAAAAAEPFAEFLRRTRPDAPGLPPPRFEGPRRDRPPPGGLRGGEPRPFDSGPPPRRPDSGPPRLPGIGNGNPRFVVIDSAGVVLIPLGRRQPGEVVLASERRSSRPIVLDGDTVGYAAALERPVLTDLEERYLSAMKDSWVFSLALAILLVIPLGLVIGGRLTSPLARMTEAIHAMRGGALRQSVQVGSRDEVGVLADSFNRMSADLADAYEELERSHATVREQAALLQEESRLDTLTQIPNRRDFDEQGARVFALAKRHRHPLTVAMVDIDHFKRVNDRFTHSTGDMVLRTIASLMTDDLRESDLVARYGGEEFAIAFPETPLGQAAILAERLRVLVRDHPWDDLHPGLRVTLSIGLSDDVSVGSLQEMLAAADVKLYAAKEAGRDRVAG